MVAIRIEKFNFLNSSISSPAKRFYSRFMKNLCIYVRAFFSLLRIFVIHPADRKAFVCQFAGQRSMVWLLVKSHHDRRLFLSMRLIDQRRDRIVCLLRDMRWGDWIHAICVHVDVISDKINFYHLAYWQHCYNYSWNLEHFCRLI